MIVRVSPRDKLLAAILSVTILLISASLGQFVSTETKWFTTSG